MHGQLAGDSFYCYHLAKSRGYPKTDFLPSITLMRSFLYRLPRFKTEVPMDLILGDAIVLGLCLNISESGLLGTFSNPVAIHSEGLLTLYYDERSFQVHAKIDGFEGDEARVEFRFASDKERADIRSLLKLLAPNATSSQS